MANLTTAEALERVLASTNGAFQSHSVVLGATSDLRALIRVIEQHTPNNDNDDDGNDDAPKCYKYWKIRWDGNEDIEDVERLMDFVAALGLPIGSHHLMDVALPFKGGDLAKLAMKLRAAPISLLQLSIICSEQDDFAISEPEVAGKELFDFFNEFCLWKKVSGGVDVELKSQFCFHPSLLQKIAILLPKLRLGGLTVKFKDPPNYNPTDQEYMAQIEEAFEELQNGLESNYGLSGISFEVENPQLNAQLKKLQGDKLALHLDLNKRGRRDIVSMPLHRDTWLQMLAKYTDYLDASYFYLRRNTWMFTPEKCWVEENQCLVEENQRLEVALKTCKKRHREAMEAKDREIQRQSEEIDTKDLEIKRLRAALDTENRRKSCSQQE